MPVMAALAACDLPSGLQVTVDNCTTSSYTVVGVVCRDRKGLVYDLFRTLKDIHIRVAYAKVRPARLHGKAAAAAGPLHSGKAVVLNRCACGLARRGGICTAAGAREYVARRIMGRYHGKTTTASQSACQCVGAVKDYTCRQRRSKPDEPCLGCKLGARKTAAVAARARCACGATWQRRTCL